MTMTFDESSTFCADCTSDTGLAKKIRATGEQGLCSICGNHPTFVINFEILSDWLESIWTEWFHIGEQRPVFNDDSDKPDYEQMGDDPELLIGQLVKCNSHEEEVVRALIELMSRGDHYNVMQGGEPLIDSSECYQERAIFKSEVSSRWFEYEQSLKHQSRYFNSLANEFFSRLFSNLDEMHVNVADTTSSYELAERYNKPVIIEFQPGSLPIFRARKSTSTEVQAKIVESPQAELSNPPSSIALEGRMSAKGISHFYGATDRETCVAELRLAISEKAISAEFELTRPVRILDLTLLHRSHYRDVASMFDDDFREKVIHRHLIRQLNWLIAQPVLPGNEFEYLPTQAMAEYLATKTEPRIDGIIFSSVQKDNGRNIVLFPHALAVTTDNMGFLDNESVVQLKADSLVIHEAIRIEHVLRSSPINGRSIELEYSDHYEHDDWEYI